MGVDARQPLLNYAPPVGGCRRWARRAIPLVLVAALAVTAWHWGPPFYRQAQVLAEQRRMMDFDPPPGTVVLTTDSIERAKLLVAGQHVRIDVQGSRGAYDEWPVGYMPASATPLLPVVPPAQQAYWPPTLFLHSRQTPSGAKRLVHVTLRLKWGYSVPDPGRFVSGDWNQWVIQYGPTANEELDFWQLWLDGAIYRPASWRPGTARQNLIASSPPADPDEREFAIFYGLPQRDAFLVPRRIVSGGTSSAPLGPLSCGLAPLRLLAGRIDPADQTRLIVPYACDGQAGIIEGRLTDADFLEWKVLKGPLRRWPKTR